MRRINKRKWLRWTIGCIIAVVLVTQLCYWAVALSAKDRIYNSVEDTIHLSTPYSNIIITEKDGLRLYFPNYGKIDLVCQTMPSPQDKSVIFCCAASFTGELLDEFKHSNIAGNHVSGGVLYKGFRCKANTGCFAYYADNGTWEFAKDDYAHCLDKAVKHKGMAFGQALIISNGKDVHNGRPCKDSSVNLYRALCEIGGKLCVADATEKMAYKDFINRLLAAGAKHALYLDMGGGWNYSYYRDNNDEVKFIHNRRIKYTTNWITFYK